MTKAVLYARFSPRRYADECESITVQFDYLRADCHKHNDEIIAEFRDEEEMGDELDRQGLWDAVNAIRRSYVLKVYNSSRLARSVYISELLHREIAKRGGTVKYLAGGHNGDAPQDVCIRQIFASIDEMRKKVDAAMTRAAMLRHQANGRAMSKVPPFGKRPGPDRVVKDRTGKETVQRTWIDADEELAIIERIKELRNGGGFGLRQMAKRLNEEGLLIRGRSWNHRTLGRICKRETA